MKQVFCPLFILLFASVASAQAPSIQWQNTIGGSGDDESYSIEQTTDHGYIIGGYSKSGISGDKTEPFYGGYWGDYWLVKLDSLGDIQWQNTIAGDSDDNLTFVQQTLDGGYILAGWSSSDSSYDKTENPIGPGYYIGDVLHFYHDYWIVKVDSVGNIEWQNTIGSDHGDYLYCIKQTFDGGYILAGESDGDSISGDKTETGSYMDYWVVKLNATGNIEWQNTIGGNSQDWVRCVEQTNDGGYILGGTSISGVSGDKTEANKGGVDYWVVKIDSLGVVQWDKTIGGHEDDYLYLPYCVQQTTDHGYILAGYSYSGISGDKTEINQGIRDYWLVKIDSTGTIQWQNTIGGSSDDVLSSVQQTTDGGYILGGSSTSPISGDKTEPHFGGGGYNGCDYWVVKVDDAGNILWQKTIGGTGYDGIGTIRQTMDNGYVIIGASKSNLSGNKTENSHGGYDYWVIKLGPECSPVQEICNGMDDDCDGVIDNGLGTNTFYIDADSDGFGNDEMDTLSCFTSIVGYVTDSTDCDDSDPSVYPGALEILNGVDDNCNDLIDEGSDAVIDISDNLILNFYPNPASGEMTVVLNKTVQPDAQLVITNISGRFVLQQKIIKGERIVLDISHFPSGIYFIHMATNGKEISGKFVKQ